MSITDILPSGYTFVTAVGNLASQAYARLMSWSVEGQTDPAAPFDFVMGSLTINGIQGPAVWYGYNSEHLSRADGGTASQWGAIGNSFFQNAGDSNNGQGGYGLESNVGSFLSPSGNVATNAFQVVAVNDETNTVNTTVRCGTSAAAPSSPGSAIYLQRADGAVTYMYMGPAYNDAVQVAQPMTAQAGLTVSGGADLATDATTGFLTIPTIAGQPTGTPATTAGGVPLAFDETTDTMWIYAGGTWKGIAVSENSLSRG
jgi:hypothetical protein